MKKYNIVALGECLIDFCVSSPAGSAVIELNGNSGGAPANVLAAAAKLGLSTAFVGKVGNDVFGDHLACDLSKCGIDISCLKRATQPTTLSIVSLNEKGDRDFAFYRDRTADVMLSPEDLDSDVIQNAEIFHFGSVSMTAEPSKSATLAAVNMAKNSGALISYDPNLRPLLWNSLSEAKDCILSAMELCDAVKVSSEEAEFLTDIADPAQSGTYLMQKYSFKLLAVTLAERGCILFTPQCSVVQKGFEVNCVDSTGAGDAFWGNMLAKLCERGSAADNISESELNDLAVWANAAGALAVTKPGAIPAMPDRESTEALCKK